MASRAIFYPVCLLVLLNLSGISCRSLQATCVIDNCGIWCGPPRPPPCGTGSSGSSQGGSSYGPSSPTYGSRPSSPSYAERSPPAYTGGSTYGSPTQDRWPTYGGSSPPSYTSPPPSSQYQQPSYGSPPQYQQPQYSPAPAPQYQQPSYGSPPQYQPPSYNPPSQSNGYNPMYSPPPAEYQQQPMYSSPPAQYQGRSYTSRNDNTPAPAVTVQPRAGEEQACFGDMPFGLENCVCDGAIVGEQAGVAACGRLFTECELFVPFSGVLEAVQQTCDTFALDSCLSAGQTALVNLPGCGEIFQNGGAKCTSQEAQQLFNEQLRFICDPICPDCPRKQPEEYPITSSEVTVPPAPVPPEVITCGEEFEFGLNNCVCDGEVVGNGVGENACLRVFQLCMTNVPFVSPEDLKEIQRTCDTLALETCAAVAREYPTAANENVCARALQEGVGSCSAQRASQIFEESIEYGCAPLCPDCTRVTEQVLF